jgi:hypothetical protein
LRVQLDDAEIAQGVREHPHQDALAGKDVAGQAG